MPYDIPPLTDEQKAKILELFTANPKTELKVLTQQVFNNEGLDGRSNEAKAVKEFLAAQNFNVRTKNTYVPVDAFEMTDDHRAFIKSNFGSMNLPELISALFPHVKNGSTLSREGRAVMAFVKQAFPQEYTKPDEPVEDVEYSPPRSMQNLVSKVNTYLPDAKSYNYNGGDMKPSEQKKLETLWGYLKTHYFIAKASVFRKELDRTLFESNFIRYTHDKPDLLAEEVNQYIDLAAEMVTTLQIEREKNDTEDRIRDHLMNPDNKNRVPESLVLFLNSTREKWDKSKERTKKLLDTLVEDRSKRLEKRLSQHDSVLRLIDAWKDEEQRADLIKLVQLEQTEDTEEFERLNSLDDVKALIAGMTKDEASHGI
jgi:hypothetical protein